MHRYLGEIDFADGKTAHVVGSNRRRVERACRTGGAGLGPTDFGWTPTTPMKAWRLFRDGVLVASGEARAEGK